MDDGSRVAVAWPDDQAAERRPCRRRARDSADRRDLQRGLELDTRRRCLAGAVRPVRPLRRLRPSAGVDVHRRQRAELERLLAPPVRHRRQRCRRHLLRAAACGDLRRDQGDPAGRHGRRRRPRLTRSGRSDGRATVALADVVHPRSRGGLPRKRTDDADHGRLRPARVRRQLVAAPEHAAHREHDDRRSRLHEARRAARRRIRRDGTARLEPPDRLRRVRGRDDHPDREGRRIFRRRAARPQGRSTKPRRRGTTPRRSSSPSASRT